MTSRKNLFCLFTTVWHTREKSQDVTNSLESAHSEPAWYALLNCDMLSDTQWYRDYLNLHQMWTVQLMHKLSHGLLLRLSYIYEWKCEESTEWRALQWQNQRNHLALLVSIVPHCLQQSARGMTLQNKASNPLLQVLPQTNVRMWTTAFPKFKLPCKRVPAKELSPMRRSPARISNSQPLSHWGPFL